jgi:phosphotransacetylase
MKPIIQNAAKDPKKIIYAEGEDERVLRAAQVLIWKMALPSRCWSAVLTF